uniref:Histone-lysine N-methyltransferase SETDB2 n=1 Tax=Knipowitschia caucasica TaxID=637954 RepID=A0AAV2L7R3_KNICA
MEDTETELPQSDRARLFWATQDLDSVFSEIQLQVRELQGRLKEEPCDKDLVQSLKLLEAFDWPTVSPPSVVQVVIGSDAAPPSAPAALPVYEEHYCSQSCVPPLPLVPQSQLWTSNPLKIPLIYGFTRCDQSEKEQRDQTQSSVVYRAPCGLRLLDPEAVMDFLLQTQSFHLIQVDMFSFSSSVFVESLSPGLGQRPPVFRYRHERWPRGCFLTRSPQLFHTYCTCRGRCGASVEDCPCGQLTVGSSYTHQRLLEPNPSGIFECGPWCGCDPGLCQNRVVQRGLRVRLQVYRTEPGPESGLDPKADPNPEKGPEQGLDQKLAQSPELSQDLSGDQKPDSAPDPDQGPRPERGWGVRCKDDLDQGTFICVYAGVVLQKSDRLVEAPPLKHDGQLEAPPLKQRRAELASDDEVQLVTEWLPSTTPTSDTAHVPVIQRGSDVTAQTALPHGHTESQQVSVNGTKRSLHQDMNRTKDLYLIDASKEGNVSRFFNHSCDPTLFVQNVFTDSHDKKFPNIAFFTKRCLKAGTELTWDYNAAPSQEETATKKEVESGIQEVLCVCNSAACRQKFYIRSAEI